MSKLNRHIHRLICVVVILLHFNALLTPFLPFIEYAFNFDYISKVLCINQDKPEMKCDGKCHLKKQITQTTEDSKDPQKTIFENRAENFLFIIESKFDLAKTKSDQITFDYISMNYTEVIHKVPTPPPKFCC